MASMLLRFGTGGVRLSSRSRSAGLRSRSRRTEDEEYYYVLLRRKNKNARDDSRPWGPGGGGQRL